MIHESDLADYLIIKLNSSPCPLVVGIPVTNREHLQNVIQCITNCYVSWALDARSGDLQGFELKRTR